MTSSCIRTPLRRLSIPAVVVVASALIGTPSAVAAASKGVPFKATVSGTAVLTTPTTGTFSGSGQASQMGAISNSGGVQAYPDEPRDNCPNGFRSVNTETFTARNGDTLSLLSEDIACPGDVPGQYRGTGTWTVTGGTGRFSGAQGGGPYHGVADFAGQTFTFTFTGTIARRS